MIEAEQPDEPDLFEEQPEEILERTAHAASSVAAKHTLWTLTVFLIAVSAYFWEAVGEPAYSSITSNGYYPIDEALGHVGLNLASSFHTIPLLWGIWELRCFIQSLADGDLWTPRSAERLKRVGYSVIAAGIAALLLSPALLDVVLAIQDETASRSFGYDPLHIALVGVGVLLTFVAWLFGAISSAARMLDQENEQFV